MNIIAASLRSAWLATASPDAFLLRIKPFVGRDEWRLGTAHDDCLANWVKISHRGVSRFRWSRRGYFSECGLAPSVRLQLEEKDEFYLGRVHCVSPPEVLLR